MFKQLYWKIIFVETHFKLKLEEDLLKKSLISSSRARLKITNKNKRLCMMFGMAMKGKVSIFSPVEYDYNQCENI